MCGLMQLLLCWWVVFAAFLGGIFNTFAGCFLILSPCLLLCFCCLLTNYLMVIMLLINLFTTLDQLAACSLRRMQVYNGFMVIFIGLINFHKIKKAKAFQSKAENDLLSKSTTENTQQISPKNTKHNKKNNPKPKPFTKPYKTPQKNK